MSFDDKSAGSMQTMAYSPASSSRDDLAQLSRPPAKDAGGGGVSEKTAASASETGSSSCEIMGTRKTDGTASKGMGKTYSKKRRE